MTTSQRSPWCARRPPPTHPLLRCPGPRHLALSCPHLHFGCFSLLSLRLSKVTSYSKTFLGLVFQQTTSSLLLRRDRGTEPRLEGC